MSNIWIDLLRLMMTKPKSSLKKIPMKFKISHRIIETLVKKLDMNSTAWTETNSHHKSTSDDHFRGLLSATYETWRTNQRKTSRICNRKRRFYHDKISTFLATIGKLLNIETGMRSDGTWHLILLQCIRNLKVHLQKLLADKT